MNSITKSSLEDKYHLEKELKKSNNNSKIKSFLLIIIILGFVSLFNCLFKKKKVYKKRYKERKGNLNSNASKILIRKNIKGKLDIPEEIIRKCLKNLKRFEKEKGYLKPKLTTHSLSKIVGINVKYLSNIIKTKKGKTFPNYINELRIKHTIYMLNKDPVFIKYTISSIAKEVGFSNTISFSQAFIKQTNLNPSVYIKKLVISKGSNNIF